jgi:hypothetical protein
LRLLQRRYDDLASSLRHRVLPELRTAHAATSERAAPVVLADGDPQTPVWLTGRGVEPNEAPRRAIESAIRLLEQLVQPPRQP